MKKTLLAALMALGAVPAHAADLDQLQNLTQDAFRDLSRDLGSSFSYKALAPVEPLGITGFDIGLEVTATNLANPDALRVATGDVNFDMVALPKLHLHKGLPANIDVGAFYSTVPGSNINLTGAELRYAFLEGGVASPAVALRGTWTQLNGVDQLDLQTTGLELGISKGLTVVTPYAGIGQVWTDSKPNVAGLTDEKITQTKYFIGANVALGLLSIGIEGDQTGDASTWGAKLALRW